MGFSEGTDNRLEVNKLSSLSQSILMAEFFNGSAGLTICEQ